jgi:phosphomannomutase
MHGVSNVFMKRAFEIYGFAAFTPVKEQEDPDPEFPTVKFPNPEEKGKYGFLHVYIQIFVLY